MLFCNKKERTHAILVCEGIDVSGGGEKSSGAGSVGAGFYSRVCSFLDSWPWTWRLEPHATYLRNKWAGGIWKSFGNWTKQTTCVTYHWRPGFSCQGIFLWLDLRQGRRPPGSVRSSPSATIEWKGTGCRNIPEGSNQPWTLWGVGIRARYTPCPELFLLAVSLFLFVFKCLFQ